MEKESKHWYQKWWAIALFIVVGLIILGTIFSNRGFDEEKFVKESLSNNGYEVIQVGVSDGKAIVSMKSLGDRNNQVWTSLSSIGVAYPNATEYLIIILTPEETCYYAIDGDFYRTYRNSENDTESLKLYNQIDNQINSGLCE
jgi:hypothetical protein